MSGIVRKRQGVAAGRQSMREVNKRTAAAGL
jgi:hypothetical protein